MPPNASCRNAFDADMQGEATLRTVAQIEFYWPGYETEKALDLLEETPSTCHTPQGRTDRLPRQHDRSRVRMDARQRIAHLRHETDREPPLSPLARSLPCHVRTLNRTIQL